MYKTLLSVLYLFTSVVVFAQNQSHDKLHVNEWPNSDASFTMLLDSTVFHKDGPYVYTSNHYDQALIMVMLVDSIGNASAEIKKLEPGKKYPMESDDTAVMERIQANGRDYVRISGEIEASQGLMMSYMYFAAIDSKFSVMITADCRKEDNDILMPIFEKAAQSLRLRK